jgi:hypothetical protein
VTHEGDEIERLIDELSIVREANTRLRKRLVTIYTQAAEYAEEMEAVNDVIFEGIDSAVQAVRRKR